MAKRTETPAPATQTISVSTQCIEAVSLFLHTTNMPMPFALIALSVVAAGILDLDEDERIAWVKDEIEKGFLDPAWMNQYREACARAREQAASKPADSPQ